MQCICTPRALAALPISPRPAGISILAGTSTAPAIRQGAHLGDLPNVTIAADGSGTMSTVLRGTRETVEAAVFDADGSAIVVHESADDYATDPTGAAGGRIACGVVARG